MPSQTKKEVDMENRQQETLTQYSRPQVTAAQVETYQTTKISQLDHQRRPSQQLDSSLSVSPTGTPQRSIISNVHEVGRGHVLPEDRSLVNSGEFKLIISNFIVIVSVLKLLSTRLCFSIQILRLCLNVFQKSLN
jgi:hypothetical protein